MGNENDEREMSRTLREATRRRADLHNALLEVEHATSRAGAGRLEDWSKDVIKPLTTLLDTIEEHIKGTESQGGLYEEIIARAPHLSNQIGRLREEHPTLHQGTSELIDRLQTNKIGDEWPLDEARDDIQRILGKVVRHRQRGADLIWEAYNLDIGGFD